jgi:hypothetical protein
MGRELSPRLDLSNDRERSTAVVGGGSPDVGNWHPSDAPITIERVGSMAFSGTRFAK